MSAFVPIQTLSLPEEYRRVILRTEAGSTVHGISLGDDDRDETAVCVEPPSYVTGVWRTRRSYMYRTAAEGQRSGPGDLDLTIHPLRRFANLAATGNPSILLTFFVPHGRLECDPLGNMLLASRDLFISANAGFRFAGYLTSQLKRYQSAPDASWRRGAREGGRDPARANKYAAHMLRLGYQGTELLITGEISLPMPMRWRQRVRDVRAGHGTPEHVVQEAMRLRDEILFLAKGGSDLPEEPDWDGINHLLHEIHMHAWKEDAPTT